MSLNGGGDGGGQLLVTHDGMLAALTAIEQRLDALVEALGLVAGMAGDLAEIKAKIAEYEPLIDMVKQRAGRAGWRNKWSGGSDGPT